MKANDSVNHTPKELSRFEAHASRTNCLAHRKLTLWEAGIRKIHRTSLLNAEFVRVRVARGIRFARRGETENQSKTTPPSLLAVSRPTTA